MNNDDLRKFFAELLKEHEYIPTSAMQTMGKLIRLTIDYRDRYKAEHDEILTVEETRKAVDIYIKVIQDNLFPDNLDNKIGGLIRLWLKEVNNKSF